MTLYALAAGSRALSKLFLTTLVQASTFSVSVTLSFKLALHVHGPIIPQSASVCKRPLNSGVIRYTKGNSVPFLA